MGCANLITVGIEVLCDNNSGGAVEIYVTDFCNLIQTGLTETVDGIFDAVDVAVGEKFYRINTQRLTSELKEEDIINIDNGSTSFKQILDIIVAKKDVARRNALKAMGAGQKELSFIVKDSNGEYWGVGFREGVQLFTKTSSTGKKKEDLNGYLVSFQGDASIEMSTIDPSLIAALLVPAI